MPTVAIGDGALAELERVEDEEVRLRGYSRRWANRGPPAALAAAASADPGAPSVYDPGRSRHLELRSSPQSGPSRPPRPAGSLLESTDDVWCATCERVFPGGPMRRAFDLLLGITSCEQTPVRTFRAAGAAGPGAGLACFEVELPYRDPAEARARGLPEGASLSFVVNAWAADVDAALDCALAWFEDLRATRSDARRVDVEPIVRRLGAAEGARRVA